MLTSNKLEECEHVNIMMTLKSVLTTQQAEFPPDIEGRSQREKTISSFSYILQFRYQPNKKHIQKTVTIKINNYY